MAPVGNRAEAGGPASAPTGALAAEDESYPDAPAAPSARVPIAGYDTGVASALTALIPLKLGAAAVLRPWLWVLRRRIVRGWAVGTLDRQRFVLAIRWSLLPPFDRNPPRLPWQRPADTRRFLLFESNFDGDWDEYLDVFGAVLPVPIQTLIWWGRGFPGLDDIDLFKRYAKALDVEPDHYAAAYRLRSADIYQAAIAREGHRAHLKRVRYGYGVDRPRWTTFLLPLKPDRVTDAHALARSFGDDDDDGNCPFLATEIVHFARVVVLHRPSGTWLLITATHDADGDGSYARALAYGPGGDAIAALVATTQGAPDEPEAWGPAQVARHLLGSIPRDSRSWLAYCGHSGWTAAELRTWTEPSSPPWPEPEQP